MNQEALKNKSELRLTSKGELRLIFVGTGSAFSKSLNQTNLLIIKGQDHILIDCGGKTPGALHQMNCPLTKIRNYFITHTHSDHIGGLEESALLNRYVVKRKPRMIITEEFQRILWDEALKGGCAYNERIEGEYLSFEDFWEPLRPSQLDGYKRETWEADIGSINLKFFRTMHIPDSSSTWEDSYPSYGVLIDEKVLYTGDTRHDPDLIREFSKKFNLETVFHDCQLYPGGVHAYIEELGELSPAVKARTFLMHYQDNHESFKNRVKELGFAGFAKQAVAYVFD